MVRVTLGTLSKSNRIVAHSGELKNTLGVDEKEAAEAIKILHSVIPSTKSKIKIHIDYCEDGEPNTYSLSPSGMECLARYLAFNEHNKTAKKWLDGYLDVIDSLHTFIPIKEYYED